MKKVAFYTLGCKLNYSETSSIARLFEDSGYLKVDFKEPSDIYVINTCSVTTNADKECKQVVKQALNISPAAYIIVIGCYAQLKPQEIASIEGVDLVLGASEKFKLLDYLNNIDKNNKALIYNCEIENVEDFIDSYSLGDRTRAFLKVQDGCDYNCSFCTIPLARGSSRSDSINNVINNAIKIAQQGVKEIVLTGINLGDFGKQPNIKPERNNTKEDFLSLIKKLDEVNEIERFRISSIEPNLLKDEIIEFVAKSKKIVPHFHIPLQSGSDKILKLMRRRYLKSLYENRINKIKSVMPHCSIGVDVIVGFPGETEEDFLETYNFINSLDVSYLHVFTYSERDNTDAINFKEVVPVEVRKKRNQMLRILSEKKQRHFYSNYINDKRNVLFESENKEGNLTGYTDNYIKVKVPFNEGLINKIKLVKLDSIDSDGIIKAKTQELEYLV